MADCSHSGLTQIPSLLPDDIDWLILSGNNITKNMSMDMKYLRHISKLDISSNDMKQISNELIEIFIKSEKLKLLDVSNNKLTLLPKNIQNLSFLHEVKIHGNELICNCDNLWMKDWFLNNTDLITDYKTIECIKPDNKPIPIIKINKEDLGCIPEPEAFAVWKIIGNKRVYFVQFVKLTCNFE